MLFGIIIFLAALGFGISFYAYQVEKKLKDTPGYKPSCDLSDYISCSKPMESEYRQLFYLSNSVMGLIYYFAVAVLALLKLPLLLLLLTIIGFIASIILGYILYFKIKSFCLICTSLYIINTLLFIFALSLYNSTYYV